MLWSPASSAWGAVVNERLAQRGEEAIAGDFEPIMLSPLVLGMPQPMAPDRASDGDGPGY